MNSWNVQFTDLPSRVHPILEGLPLSNIQSLLRDVKPSTTADGVAVFLFLISALGYLTHGRVWDKPDPYYRKWFERPQLEDGNLSSKTQASRNIAERLTEGHHELAIFWGSQSGTSERFAEALARESHTRFGLNPLIADCSDYDAETIAQIPDTKIAIFLLSTYGEGDPSDNSNGLWDWIRKVNDEKITVNNLRYMAFGLGNSNYKYYNRVLDVVSDTLDAAGAKALLPRGKADDANGGTEEDFQSWKDDVFSLFRGMSYKEKDVAYQPLIKVHFASPEEKTHDVPEHVTPVHHQQSTTNSPIVPLSIKSSYELFKAGDRNCFHMEFDLGHSEVGYKTGDHIGVWPCNPEEEISLLFDTLGLESRRNEPFNVNLIDDSCIFNKLHSPTTLETTFRHHLEICAPVPRKVFQDLAPFAPSPEAKSQLLKYGQDRAEYDQLTATTHVTLARLLRLTSPSQAWTSLPLSFVLETLLPLQPRYYSISSSSIISPRRIAITALVINKSVTPNSAVPGLTSNYLLSASKLPARYPFSTPSFQHTSTSNLKSCKVYAHIRKSKFKLPMTSSTPLVLIAAGTGLAPFRAFLQERAKLSSIGKPVGKTLLFFGCRSAHTDYIYSDELEKLQQQLGNDLEIVTAFSRDGAEKVYVQDRVKERSAQVLQMLEAGANMYICGKASMAREVDGVLEEAKIASGLAGSEVKSWTDALKRKGKWKADVWG